MKVDGEPVADWAAGAACVKSSSSGWSIAPAFETAIKDFLYEDIPASSGWHQVIGSMAVFFFIIQVFTGGLLAFNYAPTPGRSL